MKQVTVALLTADRPDYTKRTLESFAEHNDLSQFELLHYDDASETNDNFELAERYGFRSVWPPTLDRAGQVEAMRRLLDEATCEWLLWLENDWLSLRPFEWSTLDGPYECLRLYGSMKAASGPRAPTGTLIMGTTCPIGWRREDEGESAIAHWAGPPSICRTDDLRRVAKDAASLKDVSKWFRPWTWRPDEPFVTHIGDVQTPGFVP